MDLDSSAKPRIEIKGLVKRYGSITAIDGVDLEINEKGVFGLLGPNGAGKTTLIGCILGLLDYESGSILIDGSQINPASIQFKQKIGIVPQEIALYDNLSGLSNLKFFGSLYGLSGQELDNRAKELLELIGLYDRRNHRVSTYSGGMKRRLNLAAGLIHKPEIILMDEPTVGIDPQSRNLIYELVDSLKAQGITILYTTHYMDEAERLCDRIAIIDLGRIIAQGTLEELIETTGGIDIIRMDLRRKISEDEIRQIVIDAEIELEDRKLVIKTRHGRERLPEFMHKMDEKGIEITSATILSPNLEMVFLHLTGKGLRD